MTLPSTVPPTIPSSSTVVTTSIPPTSAIVPEFDEPDLDGVLAQYHDAMLRLDMAAMLRVYPSAPSSVKVRMDALRKNYSQMRRALQPSTDCLPARIHIGKSASGSWVIQELFTQ